MNSLQRKLAEMSDAERAAPATRGELLQMLAKVLEHTKALNERLKRLEAAKGSRQ